MTQFFDAAPIVDDGPVREPRLIRGFLAARIADDGPVRSPAVQREWRTNAAIAQPDGAPTQSTILPESAIQIVDMNHQHVGWIPDRIADLCRASISDPGAVTATVQRLDAAADTGYDRMLRYWLRGELVGCGLVEPRDAQTITQQEESGEVTTIGGRGSLAILDDDPIEPWKLDWYPDMQAHRMSYAHPDYDDSAWGPPYVKSLAGQRSPHWTGYPRGWNDPAAAWISGPKGSNLNAPAGTTYFRRKFTLATGGQFAMFWTGDNTADLSIDGVPISTIQNWQQLQRVDLFLSAGDHYLACQVDNHVQAINNPTAFLFSMRTVGGQGKLGAVVLRTSSSALWKVLQFPAAVPGWPVGKVVNYFLDKREAHGGNVIVRNFTDLVDSDGLAWPIVTDMTIQCGITCLQFIEQLAESYIDVKMAPGSWTLSVWNKGQKGGILPVALTNSTEELGCLEGLQHRTLPPVASSVLLRWQKNWTRVDRPPPVGFRRKSVHLQVPQIPSKTGAEALGVEILKAWNHEQVQYTANVVPRTPAQVLGIAIKEGDWVTMPNRSLVPTLVRCQSWTASTAANRVTLAIEAGDLVAYRAERITSWLQRLSDGTVEGRTKHALPNRGDTYAYTAASVGITSIAYEREADVLATESNPYPTDNFSTIVDGSARLGTGVLPRGFDVDIGIRVNGVEVGTMTIETGHLRARAEGLSVAIERDDDVTVDIPDVGFVVVVVLRFA